MNARHRQVVARPASFCAPVARGRVVPPFGESFLALCAVGIVMAVQPASGAEPSQSGAPVTVTGARNPLPAEIAYANVLHRQLDRAKRYPTGREASLTTPAGLAKVWVEVARDGRVVDRGIEQSSYSSLLDNTALALVGRTTYAALPADAWSQEATHRFRVAYQFRRDASGPAESVAVAVTLQ